MELISTLKADQYFDVSIWLANKGYRVTEDYYQITYATCRFGWYDLWYLNVHQGYAIIKLYVFPVTIYVVDLEGERPDNSRIIYYMETGKKLNLDANVYETEDFFSTSLSRKILAGL